jgi:hypothetical protein
MVVDPYCGVQASPHGELAEPVTSSVTRPHWWGAYPISALEAL